MLALYANAWVQFGIVCVLSNLAMNGMKRDEVLRDWIERVMLRVKGARMERRDYVALAAAMLRLRDFVIPGDKTAEMTYRAACEEVARTLQKGDPRGFNKPAFLHACGVLG